MTAIGDKGNETKQHFDALKHAERKGHEAPGTHEKAVAELWKRDPKRAAAIGLPKPAGVK